MLNETTSYPLVSYQSAPLFLWALGMCRFQAWSTHSH